MKKRFVFYCVIALSLLPAITSLARENTPMDAFIRRIKETNTFLPVSNIWKTDEAFDKTAVLQKVEKAEALLIDYNEVARLLKQGTFAINLNIPGISGGTYSIDLARYDFLSNDFQVHTLGANGKDDLFNYTPGLYYRGVVAGIPGSVAAFSFFNNEVYGVFSIPGEGNYTIVPNVMVGKYYNSNIHYVLYNDNDLKIKEMGPKCGTDDLPELPQMAGKATTTLNNNVYNSCTEVRVFEVGDYALYSTKGHSVPNVLNYLTALFNNQSTIYRNEGIPIVLKYVQVNSATDNYQSITTASSHPFLDTFGDVTQNTLHGCDLAILVSTALNGGYGALGGVAWLQAMCTSYNGTYHNGPYAFCDMDNSGVTNFPTYTWDVEVICHEMGHTVGSPHTHRCCWNPSGTGTTAIDGCYTIEGTCSSPGYPSAGGTIMSYCHLVSTGTNFSNGFGKQPGDTIRHFINQSFSSTCGATYNPSAVVRTPVKTLAANRECTDLTSGITYYWNDKNTSDHSDDTLVLMVKKNGNNIGNLDSTGFSVTSSTVASFGSGTAQSITFPSGTSYIQPHSYSMRRYWNIVPTKVPTSPVDVIFPFSTIDSFDLDGSVPGIALKPSKYFMYKVNSPIDPSPPGGFSGAVSSNFLIYANAATASATTWSMSRIGSTLFADMMMTNLKGGGSGFYTYRFPVGVENSMLPGAAPYVFPNPTNDQWSVSVPNSNGADFEMQIFSSDGKLMLVQTLHNGTINSVSASSFASGMYYYRIVGSENVFTGSLLKN